MKQWSWPSNVTWKCPETRCVFIDTVATASVFTIRYRPHKNIIKRRLVRCSCWSYYCVRLLVWPLLNSMVIVQATSIWSSMYIQIIANPGNVKYLSCEDGVICLVYCCCLCFQSEINQCSSLLDNKVLNGLGLDL